ncbi:hypothetical protein V6N11_052724 [Hibiscus sabdariffa]|uniref:HIG1 domain-containing protein n=1 Tax=Hibiscus sabdariffa TaxID=183260 RepID=A0ABR2UBA1_9ROSI
MGLGDSPRKFPFFKPKFVRLSFSSGVTAGAAVLGLGFQAKRVADANVVRAQALSVTVVLAAQASGFRSKAMAGKRLNMGRWGLGGGKHEK